LGFFPQIIFPPVKGEKKTHRKDASTEVEASAVDLGGWSYADVGGR
jgi:hypothetical protein